jgi:predicted nucleic acid-binding Zn ribbon protein
MSNEKDDRNSQLDSAAFVLQGLLKSKSTPLSDSFLRWRVWNSWSSIVGPEIAAHSLPVGFYKGALYVWVKSGARLQELTFVVKPLMQKINAFVGKEKWIRSIRFTQDRKSVPVHADAEESMRSYLAANSEKKSE